VYLISADCPGGLRRIAFESLQRHSAPTLRPFQVPRGNLRQEVRETLMSGLITRSCDRGKPAFLPVDVLATQILTKERAMNLSTITMLDRERLVRR
jgi:hypothetical protein